MEPESTAPDYVHCILDSLLRHEDLDFHGQQIPDDVRVRLENHFRKRAERGKATDVDFNPPMLELVGRLGAAIKDEFARSLGIGLSANSDETWLHAGEGVAHKTGLRHVGFYSESTDQRIRLWSGTLVVPEGEKWLPIFVLDN